MTRTLRLKTLKSNSNNQLSKWANSWPIDETSRKVLKIWDSNSVLFRVKNSNWVKWSETEKVHWHIPSIIIRWQINTSSMAISHPLWEIYLTSTSSSSINIWTTRAWPSNPACTQPVSTAESLRARLKISTDKSSKLRKNKSRSKW